jgi:hypothetical protein
MNYENEIKISCSSISNSKAQKPFFEVSPNPKFSQNGNLAISNELMEKFQQVRKKEIEQKQQQYQKIQSFRKAMNQKSRKKIVLFGSKGNTIIMNQNDGDMMGFSL